MGSLNQALHEGEMKDNRKLAGQGLAWSFNGVAGMSDTPLFTTPRGRTVAFDLVNDTQWPHAIHFHGHHARVLDRNGAAVEQEMWKDTVLLDRQERARIAFVADNPGKWMIHCHMLEHQAAGMDTWFQVEG